MHLERCHQSEPESCRKNEQCGRHYPARPNSMLWNHKRRLRGLICRGTRCFWMSGTNNLHLRSASASISAR